MSEGHYREIRLLGEGAFGKCYLCECIADKSLVAIKQIDLHSQSEQERKEALKEAKILEAFDHPNIIKFREVYKTRSGKLCIVMDFADGGDLAGQIKNQKGRYFTEQQVLDWFVQVSLAMKHVHDRKVLHRDIKSQNVFLTKAGIIKLGDFGIARVLSNTREIARTMVGTPYYLSPELVQNKPYSFKSDIWSLGVMLYELCTLKPPFDANSLHNLALKIVKGTYPPIPPQFSKDMKLLVSQMLSTDPNKRPTINQVLRSPIMSGRIRNCLSESRREEEFKHTVLHNQNLFGAKKPDPAPPARKPEEIPPRNIPPARDANRDRPKDPPKDAKRPAFEAALQVNKPPSREEPRQKNYHQKPPPPTPPPKDDQIHELLMVLKNQDKLPVPEARPQVKKPEEKKAPVKANWEPQYQVPKPPPRYDPEPAYRPKEPPQRYEPEPVYRQKEPPQRYEPEPVYRQKEPPQRYEPLEQVLKPKEQKPYKEPVMQRGEPEVFQLPPPRYDPPPPKPVAKPTPNLYVPPHERAGYAAPAQPKAQAQDAIYKKQLLEQRRREAELEVEKLRKKEAVDQRRDDLKQKREEERRKMKEDIMRKAREKNAGVQVQVVLPESDPPKQRKSEEQPPMQRFSPKKESDPTPVRLAETPPMGVFSVPEDPPVQRPATPPQVVTEQEVEESLERAEEELEDEEREDLEEVEESDIFAHASDDEDLSQEPPPMEETKHPEMRFEPMESTPRSEDERKNMIEDIRRRKHELRDSKRRGEVVIEWGGSSQEDPRAANERQAILYEMQEFLLAGENDEAPTEPLVPVEVPEEEDREDDIIEADSTMNTAAPAPGPPDAIPLIEGAREEGSKFNTLESIRDYLETKLGVEVVVAAAQVVSEVGMSGNDEEDIQKIYERLRNVIPLQTLQRYLFFFQTIAILENSVY